MMGRFSQDWPVYIGLVGFFVFVVYLAINSRQQEKKDKEAQGKKEDIPPKK